MKFQQAQVAGAGLVELPLQVQEVGEAAGRRLVVRLQHQQPAEDLGRPVVFVQFPVAAGEAVQAVDIVRHQPCQLLVDEGGVAGPAAFLQAQPEVVEQIGIVPGVVHGPEVVLERRLEFFLGIEQQADVVVEGGGTGKIVEETGVLRLGLGIASLLLQRGGVAVDAVDQIGGHRRRPGHAPPPVVAIRSIIFICFSSSMSSQRIDGACAHSLMCITVAAVGNAIYFRAGRRRPLRGSDGSVCHRCCKAALCPQYAATNRSCFPCQFVAVALLCKKNRHPWRLARGSGLRLTQADREGGRRVGTASPRHDRRFLDASKERVN